MLNPGPQPLEFSAQLLGGILKLEPFDQMNRQADEFDVRLSLYPVDDVETRSYQETVEVFEEEAVDGFQIMIEDVRFVDSQMLHEDRPRLLVEWWPTLARNQGRHTSRSDFYSPVDPAGDGRRQSLGNEPRVHR